MADRLTEIHERTDAATPGPWETAGIGDFGWHINGPDGNVETQDSEQGRADAEFIAHAREDVPWLRDELEMARGVLAMWELVASREEVTAVQRLAAVYTLHKPEPWYTTDCGHEHEDTEPGVILVGDDGEPVCENGFLFNVCSACCVRREVRTDECEQRHQHSKDDKHACVTMRALDGESMKDGA